FTLIVTRRPLKRTHVPYTTLFRSPSMDTASYLDLLGNLTAQRGIAKAALIDVRSNGGGNLTRELITLLSGKAYSTLGLEGGPTEDRKSTRLNSSHVKISYAVFCL